MNRIASLVVLLATIVGALAGCGGGGGGGDSSLTAGVNLTIGADTAYDAGLYQAASAHNIGAPLDDGAQVTVLNFQTGQTVKTGKISNGWCRLTGIPAGMSVAVVVTGTRSGKNYRLSLLIPCVSHAKTEYVADPVSSIAAEAFCGNGNNFAKNKVFSQEDIEGVLEAAKTFVQSNTEADFSLEGGIITGTKFGQPGNLNSSFPGLKDVIDSVKPVDSDLAKAKNMINQMQEAGVPLRAMVDPDGLDFRNVFTEQVLEKYQMVAENAGVLLWDCVGGRLSLEGEAEWQSITELTVGRKYAVVDVDGHALRIRDTGTGTHGQIIVRRDMSMSDPAGIYTVTAKKVGSNWDITQTFTGDTQQEYKLVVSDKVFGDNLGANPTINGTLTLKDKNFLTPIILQVGLSATGSNPEAYTSITLTGTLTTPQVTNTGTYNVQFAASKPSGAEDWQTIHDFPTRMSISNAKTVVNLAGGKTVTITGSAQATTQFLTVPGSVKVEPKSIEFTGSYVNTHTGLNFTGSATFNANWTVSGGKKHLTSGSTTLKGKLTKAGHPTYSLDLSATKTATSVNTTISLAAGDGTLSGNGTAELDSTTGKVTRANLTLNSSTGAAIVLTMTGEEDVSGRINVGSKKAADIVFLDHGIRVNFTDGSFKEFRF